MRLVLFFVLLVTAQLVIAQYDSPERNKFGQLETLLPTPNVYRAASGAPGSPRSPQEKR